MRCRELAGRLLDRELGRLRETAARALDEHLATCERCAGIAAAEGRLTDDLLALRSDVPFEVDVARRVVAGLPDIGRDARADLPTRGLGWAAVAALVASLGLIGISWSLAPGAAALLREAGPATYGVRHMLVAAWNAAAPLLSATVTVVENLLGALPAILRSFGPTGARALMLGWAVMAAAIVVVVGRDLFGTRWVGEGN